MNTPRAAEKRFAALTLPFHRWWGPGMILLVCALGWAHQSVQSAEPVARPNFVVILADDLGYGDVACYNPESKIPTPHVDRLAAEGMRFTDAHTPSAVCTPTRYGLLTGRYCWRTRLKYRVLDGFDPPLIEPGQVTVASLLADRGYATACIGKWHLGLQWTDRDGQPVPAVPLDRREPPRPGFEVDFTRPFTGGPTSVGFHHFFGISASLNMSPFCYLSGDRVLHLPVLHQPRLRDANFVATDEGVRSPDFTNYGVMPRLAGEAIGFLEEHVASAPDTPFFLYAALTSPHLPVVTNQEYLGSSQAGEYGDFVVETDAFLGAILETLDRTGVSDNTLVLFTSDNGGLYHYWQPVEADDVKHYKVTGRAAWIREFGHQGNAHLRGTKADIWEGGHRVPLVVRWPDRTPAGTVSSQLVELTDLLATVAAIVGADLPADAAPDSFSILPALLTPEPDEPVRPYSVHHSLWGVFAVRQGPWKLIPHRGSGGFSWPRDLDPAVEGGPPGQLYNLDQDPSETKNLWDGEPGIVARLTALLDDIRNREQ
jgi:arylsulfatase A